MSRQGFQRSAGMVRGMVTAPGDVPIFRLALGIVIELFFFVLLIMDIQASEAYLLSGAVVTTPNWNVLIQPWLLATGQLSLEMAKATCWGWGIELIFLLCVVGEVRTKHSGWFRTVGLGICVFNFWTSMNYGSLPSGLGGQFGFALITAFGIAFFGVVGLRLITSAIQDMTN